MDKSADVNVRYWCSAMDIGFYPKTNKDNAQYFVTRIINLSGRYSLNLNNSRLICYSIVQYSCADIIYVKYHNKWIEA